MSNIKKLNSQIKDVVGEVYNRLTIIENLPSVKYGNHNYKRVKVICQCSNIKEVCYKDLTKNKIKSCGCLNAENKTKVNIGEAYNMWTILEETNGYFDKKGNKCNRTFLCKCVCGKEKEINLQTLKKGTSKSCGCQGIVREEKLVNQKIIPEDTELEIWKKSFTYDGYYISSLGRLFNFKTQYMFPIDNLYSISGKMFLIIKEMYKTFIKDYDLNTHTVILTSKTINLKNLEIKCNILIKNEQALRKRLSIVYGSIKNRCNNISCKDYKNYGGRGIRVEESFDTLDKFCSWMIDNGYTIDCKLEIDREDNNGNYSADNCRLLLRVDNNRNMRRNVITWEIVNDIRFGKYVGMSNKDIASKIGCCMGTVTDVRNYRTWVA